MINAIEALTAIAETGDADAKLQLATILLADNTTNNNRELQCLKAVTLLTDPRQPCRSKIFQVIW